MSETNALQKLEPSRPFLRPLRGRRQSSSTALKACRHYLLKLTCTSFVPHHTRERERERERERVTLQTTVRCVHVHNLVTVLAKRKHACIHSCSFPAHPNHAIILILRKKLNVALQTPSENPPIVHHQALKWILCSAGCHVDRGSCHDTQRDDDHRNDRLLDHVPSSVPPQDLQRLLLPPPAAEPPRLHLR